MKTGNLIGFFDVRKYDAKKQRDNWPLKSNDDKITFGVSYKEKPEELDSKEYTNKDGETRYAVKFKIGKGCRWFNEYAQQVARPDNAELDKKRFEVQIDYVKLDGDPEKKEASGYWANAIMFREYVFNPFEPWQIPDETTPQPAKTEDVEEDLKDWLPF